MCLSVCMFAIVNILKTFIWRRLIAIWYFFIIYWLGYVLVSLIKTDSKKTYHNGYFRTISHGKSKQPNILIYEGFYYRVPIRGIPLYIYLGRDFIFLRQQHHTQYMTLDRNYAMIGPFKSDTLRKLRSLGFEGCRAKYLAFSHILSFKGQAHVG